MNKFIVTTICLIAVFLLTFKIIPGLFPGIDKLNDYSTIPVTNIKNNNFPDRINSLNSIIENNNKIGTSYIFDVDKNKVLQTSEIKVNPNASILKDSILQSQFSSDSLEEFNINDIKLKEVKEDVTTKKPIFIFDLNGKSYIAKEGVKIGKSSVFVKSIDTKTGTVNLEQGAIKKQLVLDQSISKQNEINTLGNSKTK